MPPMNAEQKLGKPMAAFAKWNSDPRQFIKHHTRARYQMKAGHAIQVGVQAKLVSASSAQRGFRQLTNPTEVLRDFLPHVAAHW